MKSDRVRNLLISASLLAWVASLFFSALLTRDQPVYGLQLLMIGPLGFLAGQLAWYANPAYYFALYWMLVFEPKHARVASSVSLGLAALTFFTDRIWLHEGFATPVTGYGIGFLLWLSAISLACITTWALPRRWPTPSKAPV